MVFIDVDIVDVFLSIVLTILSLDGYLNVSQPFTVYEDTLTSDALCEHKNTLHVSLSNDGCSAAVRSAIYVYHGYLLVLCIDSKINKNN